MEKTEKRTAQNIAATIPCACSDCGMNEPIATRMIEQYAAKELAEYKKVIEELLPIAERHVYLYGNDDSVVDRKSIIDRARKLIKL